MKLADEQCFIPGCELSDSLAWNVAADDLSRLLFQSVYSADQITDFFFELAKK